MDLTKLSDDDLKALADGRIESMSTEGLQLIAGPQEEPMPMADQLTRQLGLTARAGIAGLASLPNMLVDPFARLAGVTPPSEALQRTLTQAGLPEPQSTLERYVQAGTEALTGAGGQIGLARQAMQQLASPVSREVSRQLAAAPRTQLAGHQALSPPACPAQSPVASGGGPPHRDSRYR